MVHVSHAADCNRGRVAGLAAIGIIEKLIGGFDYSP
jgi:hypothetical protein